MKSVAGLVVALGAVALPLTHWLDRLLVKRGKAPGARRVVARPKRELHPL